MKKRDSDEGLVVFVIQNNYDPKKGEFHMATGNMGAVYSRIKREEKANRINQDPETYLFKDVVMVIDNGSTPPNGNPRRFYFISHSGRSIEEFLTKRDLPYDATYLKEFSDTHIE